MYSCCNWACKFSFFRVTQIDVKYLTNEIQEIVFVSPGFETQNDLYSANLLQGWRTNEVNAFTKKKNFIILWTIILLESNSYTVPYMCDRKNIFRFRYKIICNLQGWIRGFAKQNHFRHLWVAKPDENDDVCILHWIF